MTKLKFHLKPIMTETKLLIQVARIDTARYEVAILEDVTFSYDDPFSHVAEMPSRLKDALKLQDEIFAYMTEQGFTRLRKTRSAL